MEVVGEEEAEEVSVSAPPEEFAATQVLVRLHENEEPVIYDHPGGPLLDEQLRDFCRAQLKKEMGKNGMNVDNEHAGPLWGLLENLWVSCRNMLKDALPDGLRRAAPKVMAPAPSNAEPFNAAPEQAPADTPPPPEDNKQTKDETPPPENKKKDDDDLATLKARVRELEKALEAAKRNQPNGEL